MSEQQRTSLRLKQDFLLMLTANMDQSLAVTEGGPRLSQLRGAIFPEWQRYIEYQIRTLAAEQNIGIPDFEQLASKAS